VQMRPFRFAAIVGAMVWAIVATEPARADLILSQLIVDLQPGHHDREDLEIVNTGPDRAFVSIGPKEVLHPGTSSETRVANPDPGQLGLLVAPARMILETGQRKLIRIASIGHSDDERVYRVTVVPVVGDISHDHAGLKLLVGYDVLVLVRPAIPRPALVGERKGNQLTIRNTGNVSVELVDGKQCDSTGRDCASVDGGRIYAGAQKIFKINPSRPVQYTANVAGHSMAQKF
jgi:P pilus assembly chaperone PapD